ncbi:MAG: glycosyltransferase family 2 protein [Patescibacteria group bacterium]|nr:glycosyltransferase family 2 protein [Patescibacteria group bacterium]
MPHTPPELLVVVPYYNRQETIQRTVNSILSQTHDNFQLLIVDDASEVPARDVVNPDPRIRFFKMKQNSGRYFIDAVATRANPYPYYMPHDSDDESVPDRLAVLKQRMGHGDVDVVYNLEHRIELDGNQQTMPVAPFFIPLQRSKLVHRAHHSALYKNEILLSSGGYHPGFRVSYDTFMINVLKLVAKTDIIAEPLYVRHKMEESLTGSVETGLKSPYRARVRERLAQLFYQCYDRPDQTQAIIEGSIAQKTKAQMNCEIVRLRKEMNWS